MKAIYNSQICPDTIALEPHDRGLNFGDGVFETIVAQNGNTKYLNYHLERLATGCQLLGIALPSSFFTELPDHLHKIQILNGLDHARIKLLVWRKTNSHSGYGFTSSDYNFLIQCAPYIRPNDRIEEAGFSTDIQLSYNTLSSIKTLSALPYILAAKERKERHLDELILLSTENEICECVASNVFWRKDTSWFTPALTTGCLAGVARRALIANANKHGVFIQEVHAPEAALLQADQAVATNVTGIRQFTQLEGHRFEFAELPAWMRL